MRKAVSHILHSNVAKIGPNLELGEPGELWAPIDTLQRIWCMINKNMNRLNRGKKNCKYKKVK